MTADSLTVIVTGGAGAIGRAICHRLGASGYQIAVIDRDLEGIRKIMDEFHASGLKATSHCIDVVDEAGVADAVRSIQETSGIFGLVNAAGISPKNGNQRASLVHLTLSEWRHVLDVNLTGAFLCTRAVAPALRQHAVGRIVNIASVMGKIGAAGQPGSSYGPSSPSGLHYCASKAALISLTFGIARELAPFGITCNAVAPGAIGGGLGATLDVDEARRQIPLGRLGRPDDVAAAVGYLMSEGAAYVTGEVLDVNGGWVMD